MLFNSFLYILLFLPITFVIYFSLARYTGFAKAKIFLVLASLCFYGWWNSAYVGLLILSIGVNYFISCCIQQSVIEKRRRSYLIAGVFFNLGLLAYFKYANFFVDNLNNALNLSIEFHAIVLPLAISFFTFTQIAFLIDCYHYKAKQYGIVNYSLFVSYFPHLLAGPIIHHAQMMPQFADKNNATINYKNIYFGIVLFTMGLAKKVVLADTFAIFANQGYADMAHLDLTSAWTTSLAYTFQIYFDFSGYTDMAIGASKLFNIELPINFDSPYQSLSIREFWQRWHITLSNFLRDYLYIPMGGNRVSEMKVYRNLIVTFVIGGFWHGAGWTFIIWGLLHGIALSIQRWFKKLNIIMPPLLSWFITFNFINVTWVFFRAPSFKDAQQVIIKMFSFSAVESINPILLIMFAFALFIAGWLPNSVKVIERPVVNSLMFIPAISVLMLLSFIVMQISNSHEFIYFQF